MRRTRERNGTSRNIHSDGSDCTGGLVARALTYYGILVLDTHDGRAGDVLARGDGTLDAGHVRRLCNDEEAADVELSFFRLFTWNDFRRGYIFVYYSLEARGAVGNLLHGSAISMRAGKSIGATGPGGLSRAGSALRAELSPVPLGGAGAFIIPPVLPFVFRTLPFPEFRGRAAPHFSRCGAFCWTRFRGAPSGRACACRALAHQSPRG